MAEPPVENPAELPPVEEMLGLLRIHVKRGINLAIRDVRTSDPYVVVKMGKQRLKTQIIYKTTNPEWNEDLTLSVLDPNIPVSVTVFDHDTWSPDDKMGDAEFDILPFIQSLKVDVSNLPDSTVLARIHPGRQNCLAEESCVLYKDGKITQDMALRLRNVECGELEIQLNWIELPSGKGGE